MQLNKEPRNKTLYVRISKTNREFVTNITKRVSRETKSHVSESEIVDRLLHKLRMSTTDALRKRTLRKKAKTTKKATKKVS